MIRGFEELLYDSVLHQDSSNFIYLIKLNLKIKKEH